MKIIVFRNPDGTCGVVHPTPEMFIPKSRTRQELEASGVTLKNEKDVLDYIAAKDVPEGCPFRVTTADKLPSDRTFRGAWTDGNPTETVDVDMEKARGIHLGRLRDIRNARLKQMDADTMRALDSGKGQEEVAAKKQALRDMPEAAAKDMAKLKTPEKLAAYVPEILKA